MKENSRAVAVDDFKERLDQAKVTVIADYKGLTVKKMEQFRRELKVKGAQLKIVKNTLAKRALKESNLPTCDAALKGQVAFVLGFDDAVSGPKAAMTFSKVNKEFKVIGGIFEGQYVNAETIKALATLPSKDVLRATLLLLLQGPQRKLLGLLQAVPQELHGTLKALAAKKEESNPS